MLFSAHPCPQCKTGRAGGCAGKKKSPGIPGQSRLTCIELAHTVFQMTDAYLSGPEAIPRAVLHLSPIERFPWSPPVFQRLLSLYHQRRNPLTSLKSGDFFISKG